MHNKNDFFFNTKFTYNVLKKGGNRNINLVDSFKCRDLVSCKDEWRMAKLSGIWNLNENIKKTRIVIKTICFRWTPTLQPENPLKPPSSGDRTSAGGKYKTSRNIAGN